MRKRPSTVYEPTLQFDLSKLEHHIKIDDIRTLLISALTDIPTPEWVKVNNRGHVRKVMFLYLPGLDPRDFGLTGITNFEPDGVPKCIDLKAPDTSSSDGNDKPAAYKSMPFFVQQFPKMLISALPAKRKDIGKEFVQTLQCQVSLNERKRRAASREKRLKECEGKMEEFYVFSLEELKQYRYPIPPFLDPSITLPEGWKETKAVKQVLPRKRLMAVDCEMVKTASGSALARVTLVDEDGTTLLDEIVKPDEPVIDYLTEYSGMTDEIMKDGISLRRAQKHIRKLVTHNVILVGHGLENDLNALKLAHPYCVDTAILYHSQLGPPNKPPLRFLSRIYLRRAIQKRHDHKLGHDSAEDAKAALDLFKLKVKKGEDFGTGKLEMELIFNRLDQVRPSRTSAMLEKADTPRYLMSIMHPAEYTVCDTEEMLVQKTIDANKKHNFVISQFRTLKFLDEEDMSEVPTVFSHEIDQKKMMHERMITFDQHFQELYRSLAPGTMVVVMGSYSPELLNNKYVV
ncbi:ribonuclease H-like domain-containing protein [Dichotomocladium elegans]|nr:ribonuclease H-like domain-containing protein [Dichotomocladium elegans]